MPSSNRYDWSIQAAVVAPEKACVRCGKVKPATVEFFRTDNNCRQGTTGCCRACHRAANRAQYRAKTEGVRRRYKPRTESK